MAYGTPLWRMAFDAAERCIAIPLESVVRSDLFFDVLAVSTRARRGAFVRTERLSRRALHLVNLPAGSDMRRLGDQVARLERRVVALSKQLEDEATAESQRELTVTIG
jgi:hypothetical protein